MTDILWPISLPQVMILDGLQGQRRSNVIRTSMDAGPQKARRRYTVASKDFDGAIIVTEEQRRILEDFYVNTIKSGALRFRMKDPQTLEFKEFRFREDYKEQQIDGLWKITMLLEKMNA
ncbi:MAG: hypothetical protein UIT85_00610 [Treponema sp.]|nr:hypothetical protein [Treponema sp.]